MHLIKKTISAFLHKRSQGSRRLLTLNKAFISSAAVLFTFGLTTSASANEAAKHSDVAKQVKPAKHHGQHHRHHAHHHTHHKHTAAHQSTKADKHTGIVWDKKIHLNGITITPGGFFAGEGLWRSTNQQSDMNSTFSGIPLGNSSLAYMDEFRLSARATRLSALVEGNVNPDTLLSGYVETDFLGNGTANSNSSNSFNLRIRQAYAAIDWKNTGWQLLAGQTFSLATTNSKGITPRNVAVPPGIDGQYVVGFVTKRQPQLRLVNQINDVLWAGLSVENPQTTFGGTPCGTVLNNGVLSQTCTAAGAQSLPSTTLFSLNHIPDVIAKLAVEPKIEGHKFHIEGFGILRHFYDRVRETNANTNYDTSSFSIGAGALLEVVPKILDVQGNVLAGRGFGSYGAGGLPDVTIASDGALTAIPEVAYMAGATVHATSNLDLYLFGGREEEKTKYFQVGNNFFGYGVPNANNTGCSTEFGVCAGNTEALWQITTGFWKKFYKGAAGEMKAGLQYSYTNRQLFEGTGGVAGNNPASVGYKTHSHMVFASIRYYPFA